MEPKQSEYKTWEELFYHYNDLDNYYNDKQIEKFFDDIQLFFKLIKKFNLKIKGYAFDINDFTFPEVFFFISVVSDHNTYLIKITFYLFTTEDDNELANMLVYDSGSIDHGLYYMKKIINNILS